MCGHCDQKLLFCVVIAITPVAVIVTASDHSTIIIEINSWRCHIINRESLYYIIIILWGDFGHYHVIATSTPA